ncbi:MAG: hypothetical protein JWM56_1293 [Candidatus Peribacteria bacterium]|nr:hypothetical protein [Candidatus Peribacteria bacterium]
MKICILGSGGFLGGYFKEKYPDAQTPKLDIADQTALIAYLDAEKPDIVINCAGKTGRPNVDWCEDHKPETVRSNVTGALMVMEECLNRHIYLVHIGSGCIYQGDNGGKGWAETDPPNYFGSFYSRTKAWSDEILSEFPVLNIRLRMPFDGTASPRNLIMKLAKYGRVLDEPNSLTNMPDLLNAVAQLMEKRLTGTFNIVNPGVISPFEVMEMYKEIVDPAHVFERLTVDHLGEVAKTGRSNCILSGEKLRKAGIEMPDVREAVKNALVELRGIDEK